MLGKSVLVFSRLFVQNSSEPVLRAVRLVGNDNDIGSVRKLWVALLSPLRHELLYRAKDDSSRRPAVEQRAQFVAIFCLLRRLRNSERALTKVW